MKKIIGFVLVVFVSINFTFCACSCNKDKGKGEADGNKSVSTDNNSGSQTLDDGTGEKVPEPDWAKAEEVELYGLIGQGMENRIVIVENWGSRSKISYYVFGDKISQLKDKVGQFAKVKGLTPKAEDHLGAWSRRILVTEIIEITEEPAGK